jgi:hypothetical protein
LSPDTGKEALSACEPEGQRAQGEDCGPQKGEGERGAHEGDSCSGPGGRFRRRRQQESCPELQAAQRLWPLEGDPGEHGARGGFRLPADVRFPCSVISWTAITAPFPEPPSQDPQSPEICETTRSFRGRRPWLPSIP